MGQILDSDWSRKKLLRSDWLVPRVALYTTYLTSFTFLLYKFFFFFLLNKAITTIITIIIIIMLRTHYPHLDLLSLVILPRVF